MFKYLILISVLMSCNLSHGKEVKVKVEISNYEYEVVAEEVSIINIERLNMGGYLIGAHSKEHSVSCNISLSRENKDGFNFFHIKLEDEKPFNVSEGVTTLKYAKAFKLHLIGSRYYCTAEVID